jgi:SAM-dependent methyltransferase
METHDPAAPAPPPVTPLEELSRLLNAWRESRVALTALELDLFTAVGDGASAAAVAERLATDPRGTAILLHALAALGLLEKRGETFHNGPLAARFLRAGAPEDRRAALRHVANLWPRWSALTDCVRRGEPAPRGPRAEGETETFIAAMHANATQRAPALIAALDLGGVRRVLDVGGGSGGYAIALARAVPGLQVEVLDLADVVPLTARYAREAGVADRVSTRVGDLNADDLGAGYDLVLISAVCHMNGPAENADLLRRAARALAPRGRVVVHDYVLEPDRTAPAAGALFAVNMLVNTRGGGNYTAAEYLAWLRDAGLAEVAHVRLPGFTGLLVGRRP